jgi:hypothetical protein
MPLRVGPEILDALEPSKNTQPLLPLENLNLYHDFNLY